MDVGADNFRFTLEDQNGLKLPTHTSRQPYTTELHLDSLDRYMPNQLQSTATFQMYPNSQAIAKVAGPILLNSGAGQSGTQCVINTGRPLVYGYFSRVALTQMSINWEIPTIVGGVNDQLRVQWGTAPGTIVGSGVITLPSGYYTQTTLATALQVAIRALDVLLGAMTVTAPSATIPGFQFVAGGSTYMAFTFGPAGTTEQSQVRFGRLGRMVGLNRATYGYPTDPNTTGQPGAPAMWALANGGLPNMLYTDYVDIVSQSITNYKDAKDANATLGSPVGVLGRIWLTENTSVNAPAPNGQPNSPANISSGPISLVKTWYNPNWSQWSPNQTLNTIDITLIDSYGQVLPWNSTFATEWSATLTLTE